LQAVYDEQKKGRNGGSGVITGTDRARMRLFKDMAVWFDMLDEAEEKQEGQFKNCPPHLRALASMRFVLKKKFKKLKRAYEFMDFNANGSLA
jgi:hypothetical protein